MLEKLLDLIIQFLEAFRIVVVQEEFVGGVILRFGKFNRETHSGINFILPLYIEQYMSDNIVLKTNNLKFQSLTTRDSQSVSLSVFISYRIRNIRRWLLEVEEAETVMADMTYGCVAHHIEKNDWVEILKPEFKDAVRDELKSTASKILGVSLNDIKFCDLTRSKAIRILQE